ncbi:MAG: NAD(P)-binding domain-containing protein, partial [Candidatus Omnitrophica bacterium]|nr:NAD(P)-binding domain-containing protein [Candidatus Omnitrophota bacterium]
DKEKTMGVKDLKLAENLEELAQKVDAIILAVKPQDFKTLLLNLRPLVRDKLLISIAAGVPTKFIEASLVNPRIIRVMPNLMVKVKRATTALVYTKSTNKKDLKLAKKIFKLMGKTLILKEELIDAFTVIAGSGPAFIYFLINGKSESEKKKIIKEKVIPTFYKVSLNLGFTPKQAKFLAKNIPKTSLIFLEKSGSSCEELIKKIASKGGTTEAGLTVLEKDGSLEEAIQAGINRAKELAGIFST